MPLVVDATFTKESVRADFIYRLLVYVCILLSELLIVSLEGLPRSHSSAWRFGKASSIFVTGMSLHGYLGCTTVNRTMVCLLCGPSSMPLSVGKQWLECHKLCRCIEPKGSSKVLIWLAYKTAGNSLIRNAFVN